MEATRTPAAATASTSVPALVPYAGAIESASGKPGMAGITFLVFKDEQGGDPLWAETQTVAVDEQGRYRVQLGAAAATGIPDSLFASGEARWLEVQIAGEKPQARVLLASVPYAMKAADATTLGGLPVSAFQLVNPQAGAGTNAIKPNTAAIDVTTPGGATGFLPVFSAASAIGDSMIFQSGSKIGVGTATPAATLDVSGPIAARGALTLESAGSATPTTGRNSEPLVFLTGAYNSTTKAAVAPQFSLQAQTAGNDTAAPAATLNLLYGLGAAPAETGFSINSKGLVTFAAGQTFPGAGGSGSSITGITVTSPLTGGGTSGAIKLGLDTTKIPTLTSSPIFSTTTTSGTAITGKSVTGIGVYGFTDGTVLNTAGMLGLAGAHNTSGFGGIAGVWGDAAAHVGVLGTSTQYSGVQGISFLSDGVQGVSTGGTGVAGSSTSGAGVVGYTAGNPQGTAGTLGIVGARTAFNGIAGVWGDSASNVGVFGTSNLYSGVQGASVSGPGVVGISTSGNGMHGVSQSTSGVFGETSSTSFQDAGVYGYSHSNAMGIYGYSPTGTGVFGQAGDAAVGVKAVGTTGEGLLAFATSGQGVLANATTGVGGEFVTSSENRGAVEAYNNSGGWAGGSSPNPISILGMATGYDTVGVKGISTGGVGVWGIGGSTSQANIQAANAATMVGVWGDTTGVPNDEQVSIVGTASNGQAGIFSNNSTLPTMLLYNYGDGNTIDDLAPGHFGIFAAMTPHGTCGIGGKGDLTCTGQVKTLATTGGGTRTVETYSMQSPENWMEDFGSGKLQNGVAKVTIDPSFAETVSATEEYHVFLTPKADCKGLYVIAETAEGFEVRESGGGTASLAFDFRIVAKRRGFEAQRLVDVTEPLKAEKARAVRHLPAGSLASRATDH